MHFKTPNPEIDFDAWKLRVPTKSMPWSSCNGPRRASINSFGYGGANAHVILEEPPPCGPDGITNQHFTVNNLDRLYLMPITSHSEDAATLTVTSLAQYLEHKQGLLMADLIYSMVINRSMHRLRSFVVVDDIPSMIKAIECIDITTPWKTINNKSTRLGFVFTGQGAQYHDMGRQLMTHCPPFLRTLQHCNDALQTLPQKPDWSIMEELLRSKEESRLLESIFSQPICTALQIAITDILRQWGIIPVAVCGHSSGEIAAAYAAGLLSLQSAMGVAYYRGVYMGKKHPSDVRGSMMAIGMTEKQARQELQAYHGSLVVAAINSPSSITISGDSEAIESLHASLAFRKIFAKKLHVDRAFHSHHMSPLAQGYQAALEQCDLQGLRSPRCLMVSSVTGASVTTESTSPQYWAENMIKPVIFQDALSTMVKGSNGTQNVDIVVEIGPHNVLKGPSTEIFSALGIDVAYMASLSRTSPAMESLLTLSGQLFCSGYDVNLAAVNFLESTSASKGHPCISGRRLKDLPSYSWNHKNYWSLTRLVQNSNHRPYRHTILGAPVPDGVQNIPRWRNFIRLRELPWLRDHIVDGKVVFPAAGYCCMAIEAATRMRHNNEGIAEIQLQDVMIKAPLQLTEETEQGYEIITTLYPVTTSSRTVSDEWLEYVISSYSENGQATEHCRGRISILQGLPRTFQVEPLLDASKIAHDVDRRMSCASLYKKLDMLDLHYGPYFSLLRGEINSGVGFSYSNLEYDQSAFTSFESQEGTIIHPTLLDAAFHLIFPAIETLLGKDLDRAFVSTFMKSLRVSGRFTVPKDQKKVCFTVQNRCQLPSQRLAINDIQLHSTDGQILVHAEGVEVTSLSTNSSGSRERSLYFQQRWQPCFGLLAKPFTEDIVTTFESALSLYTFKFPSARILYLARNLTKLKSNICSLTYQGGRSRFKSINILLDTEGDETASLDGIGDLALNLGDMVSLDEPEGIYDLIIAEAWGNADTVNDVTHYLAGDGHLFAATALEASNELCLYHNIGGWNLYKRCKSGTDSIDATLIIPNEVSSSTSDIIEGIKGCLRYKNLFVTTFRELPQYPITTSIYIVLANLDEAMEQDISWIGTRRLLTMEGKTIVWLTSGAFMNCSNPENAKITGLLRTARNENSESRFVTLDIDSPPSIPSVANNILRCLDQHGEEEFAERNGCIYIPRIEECVHLNRKLPNGAGRSHSLVPMRSAPMILEIEKMGLLETLHFVDDLEITTEVLGDTDVEVEVKASALNFRDVAIAMGIIQDSKLGDECAGVVVRVGSGVDPKLMAIGDRVIAWRPGQGAHGSFVRQSADMCYRIPQSMTYSLAACLPVVLTTAYYSLVKIGRLEVGETVLIHSAAGGVGQVAIQLAQRIGARVLATCSPAKKPFICERFGLEENHVFCSRDETFVTGVMAATNGQGVDLVLNSLAGKLLLATWKCLKSFGRFVEIGKRDIHQNSNLPMDPFRKNLTFSSVDMVAIFEHKRHLAKDLFDESFAMFNAGQLVPPYPIHEFAYHQAEEAFRLLQLGKHPGKVVLVAGPDQNVVLSPPAYDQRRLFDGEKTYLLVGGLGGLGVAVAEWMCRRGARSFAFMSRSGDDRPESKDTVRWLRERGAEVFVHRGDVAERTDVQTMITHIGSRLGGIFHVAVVLEDAMIQSLTSDQICKVFRTKCQGALNLHEATIEHQLEFFVCWTSVSAICGNKGQGAYVAANAYLDALMRWRRNKNLPGTAMTLGAVPSRGLVAENDIIRRSLERNKLDVLSEQELMYLVEECVKLEQPKESEQSIDWHQLIVGVNVTEPDVWWAERSLFRNLYANRQYGKAAFKSRSKNLATHLAGLETHEARLSSLLQAFREKVAAVLGTPLDSIAPKNPLSFYGLDSIVAVEFRKWFKDVALVDLSLFDVLKEGSINELVRSVVDAMPTNSVVEP